MGHAEQGFDFGSNWQAFSESELTTWRLDEAMDSIRSLLGRDSLDGCTFLDVGCGSGLFSIAAWKLGAAEVVGIDINPTCIAVSERNRDRMVPEPGPRFKLVSALDQDKLAILGQFDIVYAWGSLHHTGDLWRSVEYVSGRVKPKGLFAVSIYNKHITSPAWRRIKYIYNRSPKTLQAWMVRVFAIIIFIAKWFVTHKSPLIKERGMDFWYDVIDWMGGYPYEYATPAEVIAFLKNRGFYLENFIKAQVPTGCNEYVFTKS